MYAFAASRRGSPPAPSLIDTESFMANIKAVAEALRANFAGDVFVAGDAMYDTCRRVHNGMIDRNPGVIARCRGVGDVQAAVRAAREHQMEIAVRGGGHNVAGNAVCDGGLMIDLAGMRGVHVDPVARRARAQGGATWGDYNRETQLVGLGSTGGVVSTTGVGGLTLGGGLGWLMGTQGMAVDCLRGATMVTSAGEVIKASSDEHPIRSPRRATCCASTAIS
jgi:FAD/FMN-containing dehydrogenase